MENTENVNSEIIDDFSPLTQDNVIQRDYTKPNVDFSQVNATPIEEPVFVAPSFEDMDANWNSKNVEEAQIVDEKAKLPMFGTIESLNVSVACGAFLYEALRQRM